EYCANSKNDYRRETNFVFTSTITILSYKVEQNFINHITDNGSIYFCHRVLSIIFKCVVNLIVFIFLVIILFFLIRFIIFNFCFFYFLMIIMGWVFTFTFF